MSEAALPCSLYRHFSADGALLYVGVSLSALRRLGQHADNAHWFSRIARVEIQHFATRAEALAAERAAILSENPAHNLMRPKEPKMTRDEKRAQQMQDARDSLVRRVAAFKPLYEVSEAADLLRVSEKEIKEMIEAGVLGGIKRGERRRFDKRWGREIVTKYYLVSGWQIIDYLEALDAAFGTKKAA